jgi:hypothetical protein
VGSISLNSLHVCSSADVAVTWQMGEWILIRTEWLDIESSSLKCTELSPLSVTTFTKLVNCYLKGVTSPCCCRTQHQFPR